MIENPATFTAIDVETAHGKRFSICQVGLVRFEEGVITRKICQLIQPPQNIYSYYNIQIHGITPEMTIDAPCFDDVWGQFKPFIEDQLLVAHNASFDISCLSQTLAYYDLAVPKFEHQCTYRIFKKNLASLCNEFHINLNHHNALSDALACAQLYLIHLNDIGR